MDKQPYVDRILETENLTDQLEDEAADYLLKWGIGQLDLLLENIKDEEAAAARVSALMKVMRGINRLAENQSAPAPDKLAELAANYAQALSNSLPGAAGDLEAIAAEVGGLSGRAAVESLLRWIQKK